MKKVLVVEDSAMVMKVIKHVLRDSDMIAPLYAESFAEAQQLIAEHGDTIFTALVDLNLPDAPNGEVVGYTLARHIPTIVLTGSFDPERRQNLLEQGVVDYVTKEGRYSYEYVCKLVHRLIKNENIQVLIVDDSVTGRNYIKGLLHLHRYQVFEAEDGAQGLDILLQNPDITLLITDYNMPVMNGCELVQNIRSKYEKSDLTVIGISSEEDDSLSARFIKSGANDFLKKPFNQEEFICRVTHNVELLEMIAVIRDASNRDFYTGAYNRHYFFERGEELLQQARDKGTPVSAVVIDLDNYRDINLHYGNEAGDYVMREIAQRLIVSFNRFLLARADGKEFYALTVGLDNDKAAEFVDKVRQILGSHQMTFDGHVMSVTFSAGVSSLSNTNLDGLIHSASDCLKRAKEAGGDLVFGDE